MFLTFRFPNFTCFCVSSLSKKMSQETNIFTNNFKKRQEGTVVDYSNMSNLNAPTPLTSITFTTAVELCALARRVYSSNDGKSTT